MTHGRCVLFNPGRNSQMSKCTVNAYAPTTKPSCPSHMDTAYCLLCSDALEPVHWLAPLKRNYLRLKVTLPNLQTSDHFLSHRLCPKICRNLCRILSFITSKCLSITKKLCQSNLLPFMLNRQSQFLWRGPRNETVLAVCFLSWIKNRV